MAYLGVPQSKLENLTTNVQIVNLSASFDGTAVTFNLQDSRGDAVYAVHERALLVTLGGVTQKPGVDYTTSGTTITFTTAPVSNLTIEIRKFYGVQRIIGVNDGVISPVKLTTGGPVWNSSGNVTISGDLNVTGSFNAGTNGLFWEDNERAKFGADNDLEIYHSGVNSFIRDSGTGSLFIEGTDLTLRAADSTTRYLEANASNGDVSLFFGNNKKFETTAQGISVTGDVNGAGNFTLTSTNVGSTASPEINLFRNSTSPADLDYLGQIKFTGKQDGGGTVNYAKITGKILDASDGTEDGILEFMLRKAGSDNIAARFRSDSFQLLNGTGLTVNGTTTLSGDLSLDDNVKSKFGSGDDLEIYHNGTHNFIDATGPADLYVRGANILLQDHVNSNRNWLIGLANGTLELYHSGNKKLETTSYGVKFSDNVLFNNPDTAGRNITWEADNDSLHWEDNTKATFGGGNDLQIYHDSGTGDSFISESGSGNLKLTTGSFRLRNAADDEHIIWANEDAEVRLYYDNSKKFETTTTGAKVTGALEVTQEYPSIRPILDLNFAATKTLDRRITFRRSSVGTFTGQDGLLKYASNNVPRFDHDLITRESLGLLIEESRTNLIETNIDNWNVNTTIKTTNAGIAPDGTNTANKFIRGPVATYQNISAAVTNVPTGTPLIMSWYMKAAESDSIFFQTNDGGWINGTFDISVGGLVGNGGNLDGNGMYAVGNGWYRCWVKFDSASNALNLTFHPITASPVSGNSVDGTLIWGVQLEAGSYISSYIPTDGTVVTRAQDTPLITGTNFTDFYNQSEGTLVLSADIAVLSTSNQAAVVFEDTSSQSTDLIAVGYRVGGGGSGNLGSWYQGNSTAVAYKDHSAGITANTEFRQAFAYKKDDLAASVNGGTPLTDSSGTLSTSIDRVRFGEYYANGMIAGHIKSFKYYNKRLTNAQLQGLTQQ